MGADNESQTALSNFCAEDLLYAIEEFKRIEAENETLMQTMQMIADRPRKTKEQRLAKSCLIFLDSLRKEGKK
jgi:hypothetical protein